MKIAKSLGDFFDTPKNKKQYVYVPEEIVTAYSIKECKDRLTKVKEYFDKERILINCNQKSLLRKKTLELLVKAAKNLPNGYMFKLSEGFRSLRTQEKLFEKILKSMKKKYPKKNKKEIWEETTKYIADPTLCPPHTTGGAIDITIINKKGKMLDMGIRLNSANEISNTFYPKLKESQKKNRKILFKVLTNVGFVNLPTEWWHYSYGDQYWAIFNKKTFAIYGKLTEQ